MTEHARTLILCIIGGILTILLIIVWTDPHANVPILSPTVCTLKGATWTDGNVAWGIPPGCYESP